MVAEVAGVGVADPHGRDVVEPGDLAVERPRGLGLEDGRHRDLVHGVVDGRGGGGIVLGGVGFRGLEIGGEAVEAGLAAVAAIMPIATLTAGIESKREF